MVTLPSRDSGGTDTASSDIIHTDLLIVGAGPAGASLACFLAAHGRKGLLIASAPGTASTPRAHITNMAGLECLRDIGLEEACLAVATPSHNMAHTRWCHSMAGDEFARVYSWGHHPTHKGAYETASPCRHVDLPQTLLEPILVRQAVEGGWSVRFGTEWVGMERVSEDVIVSEVYDKVVGRRYKVQSRFVFGCDGARSRVVKALGLPLDKKPGQGLALNVLVKADLSRYMETRVGNLHWVVRPDEESCPPWGWAVVVRMVKAWNEWMFIFLPAPWANIQSPEQMDASDEEYIARVKDMIGDDKIKVELLHVGKWWINETVAQKYSDGNVFCFGDATHRHPPFNGLGSNTCIQDAFNLAWKIDYVMSGKAGPKLLDSFSLERQPVGADVITRANQGMRDHGPWQQLIGMHEQDWEKRKAMFAALDDPGEKGRLKRQEFQQAIENTETEFHGLGIEMNQRYVSDAVYLTDEDPAPAALEGEAAIKTHVVTTYPGRRLPHVWLNDRTPGKPISTIDLAGHGRFCLLTGPGGDAWKDAARIVSQSLGVDIVSFSIGWKQDYADVYFDWARKREVEEDGCVLVRPDRFVAWRSSTLPVAQQPVVKLEEVMRKILSL